MRIVSPTTAVEKEYIIEYAHDAELPFTRIWGTCLHVKPVDIDILVAFVGLNFPDIKWRCAPCISDQYLVLYNIIRHDLIGNKTKTMRKNGIQECYFKLTLT